MTSRVRPSFLTPMLFAALSTMISLIVTGCGCGEGELAIACSEDSACPNGRRCAAGFCTSASDDLGTGDGGTAVTRGDTRGDLPPGATACGASAPCASGACLGGYCQDDPCAATAVSLCADETECAAACVRITDPCEGVTCPDSQTCFQGSCVAGCFAPSPCLDVTCNAEEYCHPLTGQCQLRQPCDAACPEGSACNLNCVGVSPCADVECEAGQRCVQGTCVEDRCADIVCEGTNVCVNGACVDTCDCGEKGCKEGERCQFGQCDCVPSCSANAKCGDEDGCGGQCQGTCPQGESCESAGRGRFACQCQPNCDGKSCGEPDGCGGSCTTCPTGRVCHEDNCCEPNCEGRACGDDDGCGGTCSATCGETCENCASDCGACNAAHCGDDRCDKNAGESCSTCRADCGVCETCGDGECSSADDENGSNCPEDCKYRAPSCGDGVCQSPSDDQQCKRRGGQYQCECRADCEGKTCGEGNGCGGVCNGCPTGKRCQRQADGDYSCQCKPNCSGKQCLEDDGCGGQCTRGACSEGEFCTPGGCEPDPCDPACGCGEQCLEGKCVATCDWSAGQQPCGCNTCCNTGAGEYCDLATQGCLSGPILH